MDTLTHGLSGETAAFSFVYEKSAKLIARGADNLTATARVFAAPGISPKPPLLS